MQNLKRVEISEIHGKLTVKTSRNLGLMIALKEKRFILKAPSITIAHFP